MSDDKINNTKILYERLMILRGIAVQSMIDYLNNDYPFPEENEDKFKGMVEDILRQPEEIPKLWEKKK
jgi:hypothetical protein